ncbi:efflux RND transporter periplasmic adaptor subunit [Novipirellula artificiosorum]|uniref:Multidrug resistance protein MdtE n=1 Tax=Novipirellula artificiosorum TaxID=2528016 RepID=A0A5C6DML9_9BACT|nr:efflux RND transporter periplasmic adaptor subunit [Novipirellula artificiosorum]TWU36176.1 Multidrug resistance protein MdtE precursor [Novipirellula artificiosorum]
MICSNHRLTGAVFALVTMASLAGPLMAQQQLEGFTEPYRRIAVPASEIGVISEIAVVEGDEVLQSQLLARLNDTVLVASLEVARASKDAMGTRRGAEAEVRVREKQLASYRELQENGNASRRELDRSETEYQQAIARLQAIDEELEVRRLEYERVKAQVQRRRIESPISGVVVEVAKEAGEFVSPTDPIVLQVVQLDQLKAIFSVPLSLIRYVREGAEVTLQTGRENRDTQGIVEFVSPVADAESGSVRVKIRIPNLQRSIQSGIAVRWFLDAPTVRISQRTD